jgi:hypothetical protein
VRLDHLLSKESHRWVGCLQALKVCGSPFTGFHAWTAVRTRWCVGGGCGWVEHIDRLRSMLGTLLGPEETSGWVFFRWPLLAWLSNASVPGKWGVGCGGGCGVGVWLCVECCIVDASILLCVSV